MHLTKGYGRRVASVRAASGLSQVAFAKQTLSVGASAQNIGRIERESVCPRPTTLQKIARFAGCNLEWLTHGRITLSGANRVLRVPGIGRRIAAARKAQGLSQRALAKRSGLGESAKNVGRIEIAEVHPRIDTVRRLAKVLGMQPEQLIYG